MKRTGKTAKPIFAKNIISARKALGWSANKLAERARIPYPTLRDIEAGYNHGREETRKAIADALGQTMAALYIDAPAEAGLEIPKVTEAAELLSKFASLSPPLQSIALTVIYQDTTFLEAIPPALAKEMAREIGRLFQPIQKVGQK